MPRLAGTSSSMGQLACMDLLCLPPAGPFLGFPTPGTLCLLSLDTPGAGGLAQSSLESISLPGPELGVP